MSNIHYIYKRAADCSQPDFLIASSLSTYGIFFSFSSMILSRSDVYTSKSYNRLLVPSTLVLGVFYFQHYILQLIPGALLFLFYLTSALRLPRLGLWLPFPAAFRIIFLFAVLFRRTI